MGYVMGQVPFILLHFILVLFMAIPGAAESDGDYLSAFGPEGRPDNASYDYSPALVEFMTRDYRPGSTMPVYLGGPFRQEPVQLGSLAPSSAEQQGERWYPHWPDYSNLKDKTRSIPARETLSIEEYHVPSIVEFLNPNWRPEEVSWGYYVPALAKFANASWKPPKANYSLHVPAIGEFLSDEWPATPAKFGRLSYLDGRIPAQMTLMPCAYSSARTRAFSIFRIVFCF